MKGHLLERDYCDCRPRRGGLRLFSEGKSPPRKMPLRAPEGTGGFHFLATFVCVPLLGVLGIPLTTQTAIGSRSVATTESVLSATLIFPAARCVRGHQT